MLKVSNIDGMVKCRVEIQIMISGKVKKVGDKIDLKFSVAKMLESSGRVSIVTESITRKEPIAESKSEPVKLKPKVKKRESYKHNRQRH